MTELFQQGTWHSMVLVIKKMLHFDSLNCLIFGQKRTVQFNITLIEGYFFFDDYKNDTNVYNWSTDSLDGNWVLNAKDRSLL